MGFPLRLGGLWLGTGWGTDDRTGEYGSSDAVDYYMVTNEPHLRWCTDAAAMCADWGVHCWGTTPMMARLFFCEVVKRLYFTIRTGDYVVLASSEDELWFSLEQWISVLLKHKKRLGKPEQFQFECDDGVCIPAGMLGLT